MFSRSKGGERLVSGQIVVAVDEGPKGGVLRDARLLDVFGYWRLESFPECESGEVVVVVVAIGLMVCW